MVSKTGQKGVVYLIWLLLIAASGCLMVVVALLLPKSVEDNSRMERQRLMNLIGYTAFEEQARQTGWKINIRHYLFLLLTTLGMGYGVSLVTGNYLYVFLSVLLGFFIPRYVLSNLQYRRRKEILIDLPQNLRLWASQFRDCKSVVKSLESSLPMMEGATKPSFMKLLDALQTDTPLVVALIAMRKEIRFRKFDDFCDRLILGSSQGFHVQTMDSLREIIDDIAFDIRVLHELDIQNKQKRLHVHTILVGCWCIPFMLSYMESEVATATVEELFGKILLATMAFTTMVIYLARDKYMRLNLHDL